MRNTIITCTYQIQAHLWQFKWSIILKNSGCSIKKNMFFWGKQKDFLLINSVFMKKNVIQQQNADFHLKKTVFLKNIICQMTFNIRWRKTVLWYHEKTVMTNLETGFRQINPIYPLTNYVFPIFDLKLSKVIPKELFHQKNIVFPRKSIVFPDYWSFGLPYIWSERQRTWKMYLHFSTVR